MRVSSGRRLSRFIDENRQFVAEAIRSMPVVNAPCEVCKVVICRSCRPDRIICGGCDFKRRCAEGIDVEAMRRQAKADLDRSLAKPARRYRRHFCMKKAA